MTDKEKTFLINKISDCFGWLTETTGSKYDGVTIDDLIKCNDNYYDHYDIYEVFVEIHLINGECITLRNHCYESFMEKQYLGDSLEIYPEEEVVDITHIELINNSYISQFYYVPISSILYIHEYCVNLNWLNLSKFNKMIATD